MQINLSKITETDSTFTGTITITDTSMERINKTMLMMEGYARRNPVRIKQERHGRIDNMLIFKFVCAELNTTYDEQKAQKRSSDVVLKRKFICHFIKIYGNMLKSEAIFGKNFDHANVLYHWRTLNDLIETDLVIQNDFDRVLGEFKRRFGL